MEIKKATRQGIKPLICLYSESGCGKTMSALLLARGMVGSKGKPGMIDSESGRGSLYADIIPGGYEVLELREPFAPARYVEAIQSIEKVCDIGIIDSASHEWEGLNGVLDMAAAIEERTGKPGLHCWRQPKMEHAKFVLKLLQSPIPWIVCLRAKYKSRQIKENGKTAIVKDDHTSPQQSEDFIFEATVHFEILMDHSIVLTKCSHPALRECFPAKGPITIQTGEAIARWCSAPTIGGTATLTPPTTEPEKKSGPPASEVAKAKAYKRQLWELTRSIHGVSNADGTDMVETQAGADTLQAWLVDEALIDQDETLAGLTSERLAGLVEKVKEKLRK